MVAHPWPPVDPGNLEPALTRLPKGSLLFRVRPTEFGANEFNPRFGRGARFHFFDDPDGERVPSLYAAESVEAAITEVVFHEVPVRPPERRRVSAHKLKGRMMSVLRTRRDLSIIELHHPGLGRLGLKPVEITTTSPAAYPRTREWARALHASGNAHGLVWMSRLINSQKAYFFFGDRVTRDDLEIFDEGFKLWMGPGLRIAHQWAERAGITIVHP